MGLKGVIKKIIAFLLPEESKRDDNREYSLSLCNENKVVEINHITNNIYNLNIDVTKLKQEEKEKLIEIYPEIRQNNGLILEQNKFNIFKEQREKNRNVPLLKFFKGKIKEEDYQALRMSVYIQRKFSNGEDIKPYLNDLYKKYGQRGYNINNLNGRGYFESFIKLNYTLLQSQERENEFLNFFDKFIMEQPITYFVNQMKSQEVMNEELLSKINKCKRYGIRKLSIHGMGKINKEKIDEFIKIIEDRSDIKIVSRIEIGVAVSLILEIALDT